MNAGGVDKACKSCEPVFRTGSSNLQTIFNNQKYLEFEYLNLQFVCNLYLAIWKFQCGALVSGGRASNTWVIYPKDGHSPAKAGVIPDISFVFA